MTYGQWQTVRAVAAAVVSFLIIQPQVQPYPVLLLILGAINVALAALPGPQSQDGTGE